jgi:hypothetical protein
MTKLAGFSEFRVRLMRSFLIFVSLCIVQSATGCGRDYKRVADDDVRTRLLSQLQKKDAIPFFEKNGHYFLPLLRELNQIAATDQWVMLDDEDNDRAFALLIALPHDRHTIDRMAAAVQRADDKFSGFILQQWGHNWMSLILIDQKAYEFLKEHNPDIDNQR